MATFIKTKFRVSDDQTNIDKYRLAANFTAYHIKVNLTKNHYSKNFDDKLHVKCKKFPVERKKLLKSVHKQGNWALVVQTDI